MDDNRIYTVRTVQFRPYPETGEFACVGVCLYSLDGCYFNYKFATGPDKKKVEGRIRGFFPELGDAVFNLAYKFVKVASEGLRRNSRQGDLFVDPKAQLDSLVRPRENVIRFGDPGVVMCSNPELELKRQYDYAVMRSFVVKNEAYVFRMQRDIRSCLTRAKVKYEQDKKIHIKKFDYTVRAPFYVPKENASRIVKPLDLNKKDVSDILHCVATWAFDAKGIKEVDPSVQILCPTKFPAGKTAFEAAHDVMSMKENKSIFSFKDYGSRGIEEEIVKFAR